MCGYDKRLLPAWVLMAAVVFAPNLGLAQASTANSATPVKSVPTQTTPEQLADSLMAHQRYQAAIEAYKKAPTNDPGVWNKMGIAYQLMFNLTDAMHCYTVSHKLDPKNSNVLNNLGTIYDAMKQFHNAEKMYRKALKLDPESALVMKNLGTNLLSQHKYAKGWQEYQAALKVDPDIFENTTRPRIENPASVSDRGAMNYYLARGCVRAGMPQRAIEYLRLALNEGYTNPKKLNADNEFAALRGLPEFEELLASQVQKRP